MYISQMKEHDKTKAKELTKAEIRKMPSKESKVMVEKILTGLEEWRITVGPSTKIFKKIKKN